MSAQYVDDNVSRLGRARRLVLAYVLMNDEEFRGQILMRHPVWPALCVMVASCRFDLPVSETDAPSDGTGSDMPVDEPGAGPNCRGLAATCGAGANEHCCQAAMVPGGTFYRTYDVSTDIFNDLSYPATVSTFMLDKHEVTVGRFRTFVNAGMGTQVSPPAAGAGVHPNLAGSGWDSAWNGSLTIHTAALISAVKCHSSYQTWTDTPGANENKPINCVTWHEAMAFCIWDGGYLPTEAEWNYAASGGNEQRAYPWSNPAGSTTIDCTYATYNPGAPCLRAIRGVGAKSPRGDGKWGHSDLAGNVLEWTLDWYASVYPLPCNDCANLTPTSSRVARGGHFYSDKSEPRTGFRETESPTSRPFYAGLRCARAL